MTDFSDRAAAFIDELFRLEPTFATAIGEHAYDDRWPDRSPAGREARMAFTDRWLAELSSMSGLSADHAIDRDLLVGELEAARFDDVELREEAWNPLHWIYLIGDGLFTLQAREFAPLADRLASTAGRLERLPAVLDDARAMLVGTGDRPVGRFQTETALERLAGIEELIADALSAASDAVPTDDAVAAVRPRLDAAATIARAAVAAFETHLRGVVLPGSDGEGRLGRELFAAKMRHTMRSAALTPERILGEAERSTRRSAASSSGSRASCGRPGGRANPSRHRTTRSFAGCSTRSPQSIRRPRTCSTSAAGSWARSRRSAVSAT
jgi:uncharacterized protein (DUF885 family)